MSFRDLHYRESPLVLPNAWDVPSALAFVEAGFRAVGTTSFGVAASLGRPDGDRCTRDANLRLAGQLAPLDCYVSVDIEDGYSDDPDAVAGYVNELPAAGINIEDSSAGRLIAADLHAEKVRAIKRRRLDVFVNARVDTYWLNEEAALEPTLDRARRYVAAGADGVFVPGTADREVIGALAAAIGRPLNVLAIPGASADELGGLGVRRISTGSLPYRAAVHAATEAALAVRDNRAVPEAVPYPALQQRLVSYDASRDR
jgi:2-methylisocitrate lyase-like PEP mutase family enzyme